MARNRIHAALAQCLIHPEKRLFSNATRCPARPNLRRCDNGALVARPGPGSTPKRPRTNPPTDRQRDARHEESATAVAPTTAAPRSDAVPLTLRCGFRGLALWLGPQDSSHWPCSADAVADRPTQKVPPRTPTRRLAAPNQREAHHTQFRFCLSLCGLCLCGGSAVPRSLLSSPR